MSNPIRDSLSSFHSMMPAKCCASRANTASFQQAALQAQQAQISFVTDEGDIVTLSHSQSQAYSVSASQRTTPVSFGQNFTLASLDVKDMALSVQGDLSQEELADIKALMEDLIDIATNFFNGEMDAAMTGAMNLGDMGSVSELSATFSYVAAVSTQATAQTGYGHPLPAFGAEPYSLLDEFRKQTEAADSPDNQYVEMLRAQWQQILEMLDQPDEVDEAEGAAAQPASEPQNAVDTAEQMVNRIEDTVAEHPRLSPFARAFADKAIEEAHNRSHHHHHAHRRDHAQHGEGNRSADHLKRNVHKGLSDWMVDI